MEARGAKPKIVRNMAMMHKGISRRPVFLVIGCGVNSFAEIQNAFGVGVKRAVSRPEGLDSIGGY